MLPRLEKWTSEKVNFFVKLILSRVDSANIFKELLFYITFGLISDINRQGQVQISSANTDANLKENQVDADNTQNKLENGTRSDGGNN